MRIRSTFYISIILFFALVLGTIGRGSCAVITAVTGSWEAASTWSNNVSPVDCNGDTLIIPAGNTVTINSQETYTCSLVIYVYGTLTFQNGKKITLSCGSYIALEAGGTLDPGSCGGSCNTVTICGTTDWKASNGTLTGPYCLPIGNGGCSVSLPITLVSFTAKWEQSSAYLQWVTASEINNDHFDLSRSSNGYDYETIATIKGQGNTTTVTNYSYVDDGASLAGSNQIYYRLKQVDFDGHYTFYGPIVLNTPVSKSQIILFPNPLPKSSVLHLLMNGTNVGKIILVDVFGRTVFSEDVPFSESATKLNIELPDVAAGVYTIVCQSDGLSQQQKLMVIDN